MDLKKKIQKPQLNNHHKISIKNIKANNTMYNKDYNSYDYSFKKGNNIKIINNLGSSYIINKEKEYQKSNIIVTKINQNDKNKKNNFYLPFKKDYNSFNEYKDDNKEINFDENKMILRQKRKKILQKKNINDKEEKIKVKTMDDKNINKNKIKYDKLKEIINKRNFNNNMNNKKIIKVNTTYNNDDVYFYNGRDNFIIKEKYNNIVLNNGPIFNIHSNQIPGLHVIPNHINQLNKPKIEVNNFFNTNSINFQKIYPNEKLSSSNKIIIKKNIYQNNEKKIYKKKITNNSLSLSRHSIFDLNNSNKTINMSKLDLSCFNPKKIKKMSIFNESTKEFFKINTSNTNSNTNNNISSNTYRKYKVYIKPNHMKKNITYFHQSFQTLNENKKYNTLLLKDKITFLPLLNEQDSQEKKNILEEIPTIKNMKSNIKIKKELNSFKRSSLNSKENKGDDNVIFSNSIEEISIIGPKISINKRKDNQNNCYTLERSNDNNIYNNEIPFKENISPINSLQTSKLIFDENNINKKPHDNRRIFIKKNDKYLVQFPISKNLYITSAKKIINEEENNINKVEELNSNNSGYNSLIYIPIKTNEEKKENNSFYIFQKELMDKLNEKIVNNNKVVKNIDNKKNTKERYSLDEKKIIKKSNNLSNLINNNNIDNKEELDNKKNKSFKFRSVVKIIKKNKKFNFLSQSKTSKEEENKIKQEIKLSKEQINQDQVRNDKISIILKEDFENFISFYDKNINEENITEKNDKCNIKKKYDWSIIEQLIIKTKVDLIDIINCFLLISEEIIDSKNKLKIWKEYINKIINHYKNIYLNENNIQNIHIKILKILAHIENICINNKYKYEILGYLFYKFLIEEIFNEEDLNYFENEGLKFIIEIAKVIKFIIILFSNDIQLLNDYHNKFKNLKIFNKNPIYFNYVTKYIKSSLNIKFD